MVENIENVETIDVVEADVIEALCDQVEALQHDLYPDGRDRFVLVGEGEHVMAEVASADRARDADSIDIAVGTLVDVDAGEIRDEIEFIVGEDETHTVGVNIA